MKDVPQSIKLFVGLLGAFFLIMQLNGCATATAGLECGVESMNPTILAALDSFESAAIAIKLSNRILLQAPTTELDKWPEQLYGAPSGTAAALMGLSLLGSSQGVTIPLEVDPSTGFPRPTSALYLFLKDRDKMLNTELNNDDKIFFDKSPKKIISRKIPPKRFGPDVQIINEYVYRSPLMAFGVVNGNQDELAELQEEINRMANGFTRCDKFLHIANQQQKKSEGIVKSDYCKDPELTDELLAARLKKNGNSPGVNSQNGNENSLSQQDFDLAPDTFGVTLIRAGYSPDTSEKSAAQPSTRGKSNSSGKKAVSSKTEPAKSTTTKNKKKTAKTPAPPVAPVAPGTSSNQSQSKTKVDNSTQATKSPEMDVEVGKIGQITEKKADLDDMKKEYGKLAGRVHKASVAGADFTMAALTKLTCAVINGSRALPNAKKEIEGWKGAYNAVMLLPRIKIIIDSLGYYRTELSLQFTAYKTMYKQLNGTYDLGEEQTPKEKQATETMIFRIEAAEAALEKLEPKLQLLAEKKDVVFTDQEIMQLVEAADAFPVNYDGEQSLTASMSIITP